MPYLYRIVDSDNNGMFTGSFGDISLVRRAGLIVDGVFGCAPHHPIPEDDPGLNVTWKGLYEMMFLYKFAFCGTAQLRRWMFRADWLVKLHEHGGHVLEIEYDQSDVDAQKVIHGELQSVIHEDLLKKNIRRQISLLSFL